MQFLQAYYRGMNTHTYNTNAHTHTYLFPDGRTEIRENEQ